MEDNTSDIASLIIRHLNEELDAAGREALEEWLARSPDNRRLLEEYEDPDIMRERLRIFRQIDKAAAWKTLVAKWPALRSGASATPKNTGLKYWFSRLLKYLLHWKPGAAPRSISIAFGLLILAILLTFWLRHSGRSDNSIAASGPPAMQSPVGSGHPGKEIRLIQAAAFLAFPDGSRIDLDTVPIGRQMSHAGNNTYIKEDSDMIGYRPGSVSVEGPLRYDRLYTTLYSRRGSYRLTLPDGSRVWLNAASSLQIPAVFTADERQIGLEGEAYFEVAPQKGSFTVETAYASSNMKVEALGTAFDIMAYPGDVAIHTTLMKGKVNIRWGHGFNTVLQRQGRQIRVFRGGHSDTVDVDIANVLSWKNNEFRFEKAALPEILAQLGRWYGRPIVNRDTITDTFTFTAYRSDSLSAILEILKGLTPLRCEEEGNKIIITRK